MALGLQCLLDDDGENDLKKLEIQLEMLRLIVSFEKISIWSMIALTHDLGYPFGKAQGIIDRYKGYVMKCFISNPTVSYGFVSFNGIQT